MKKGLIGIFIICLTLSGYAQEAKKYAIKSGYLKLQLTGNTVGTKEIWWDDYGQKSAEHEKSTTTTKMFGMKSTEEKDMLTILVKDKYWVVDYTDNSGSTGTIPFYQDAQDFANGMTEQEQEEFSNEVLTQLGGQKVGTEVLNGYKCEVFTLMGSKSWAHKGLILKSEAKILGIANNEMFTEFKPNASVPSSKFTAPSGYDYEDLTAASQNYWSAMGDYEDEDDYEDVTVPVKYPYEKFKNVIAGFSYPGYSCRGTNSMDGIHASTFLKGFNSLMIVAESRQNAEEGEHDGFVAFSHNGHKCYYGEVEDEDGTALIVEYANYDMYVVIGAIPDLSKEELLKISDKLKF